MKLRRLPLMFAVALAVGLLTPGCNCTGEEEQATKTSAAQTSNNLATIQAERAATANNNSASNSNALSGGLRSNNSASNGVTENLNNTNARDAN